jgi:cytosine/adenosine deaminase-related metal-dependent hydrolase
VDMTHPQLQPMSDPRRGLIALANRADIAQVFVDGRLLLDAGCLVTGDEAAICAAGAAAIERIWDLPEARVALPR